MFIYIYSALLSIKSIKLFSPTFVLVITGIFNLLANLTILSHGIEQIINLQYFFI
jgi:hypothetical protein